MAPFLVLSRRKRCINFTGFRFRRSIASRSLFTAWNSDIGIWRPRSIAYYFEFPSLFGEEWSRDWIISMVHKDCRAQFSMQEVKLVVYHAGAMDLLSWWVCVIACYLLHAKKAFLFLARQVLFSCTHSSVSVLSCIKKHFQTTEKFCKLQRKKGICRWEPRTIQVHKCSKCIISCIVKVHSRSSTYSRCTDYFSGGGSRKQPRLCSQKGLQ